MTGELAARPGSLLNLEINANTNPQITFDVPFTKYGTIELDQSVNFGRITALGFTTGTLVNAGEGTIVVDGVNGTRGIFAAFENHGTVTMAYSLSIEGPSAYNGPGGLFEGNGSLSLVGTNLVNGGVLSPGIQPDFGQLDLFGDYVQEEQGAFTVEIGGLAAGSQFDQMTVVNNAILDGALNIVLADGFVPAFGDSFVIVNHGTRLGEFSALTGVDIGGGLLFNIAYRPDYVVLAAGDFLPPATHVITASAGIHGNISPEGEVYLPDHGNVTFAINPDPGNAVGDVLVDDVSVGPAALYHFGDVVSDHTIESFFTPSDFSYESINIGSVTNMNGVHYGSRDFGVVVGDGGEIRITEDAGLTWRVAEHGITDDLQDVRVIGDIIFVVGNSGTVCISYDGGVTWILSSTGTTEALNAIDLAHSAYGYTVGDNGTVLCWNGEGWIPQSIPGMPPGATLEDITIVDGIVYIVGSNGLVIRRDNPDSDWVVLWSGQPFNFHSVSFYGGSTGYAVGSGGHVWYTGDGGATWSPIAVGVVADLHDCIHFSDSTVWIVGDGGIFIRTIDGGLSWHEVEFPRGDGFLSMTVAECRGVITGLQGVTYAYETDGCVEEPGEVRGHVRLEGVGHANVTVQLRDIDDQFMTDILTNSAGYYQFPNLVPQAYILEVVLPSGTTTAINRKKVLVRSGSFSVVDFELQTVSGVENALLPVRVACRVYPNPFNPMTTFRFELPRDEGVALEVFDIAGRLVARLLDGKVLTAGHHTLTWRGNDSGGRRLASGIYHYRLEVGGELRQGKITLLK